ncbi:MAG: M3 family oligoendopeptidase [Candidatus Hodarchaeota archaeon]
MTPYTPTRWSLKELFPSHDSPEVKSGLKVLDAEIAKFEKYRDSLSSDMDINEFLDIIKQQEAIRRLSLRISQFATLQFSEDTQDQDAQAFQAKIQNFMSDLNNRILFFSLWFKGLDDDEAARFLEAAGDYQHWLEQIRKYKPFTLSEPEEKIINIKDVTGTKALRRLYSTITNRYVFKVEIDGEMKELTYEELVTLAFQHDAELRERAYKELYRVYIRDGPILGQIYQSLVRDFCNENLDLRGYPLPISWRNLSNEIPDEVIETLLEVAQKNTAIFQRYFKLKAKWLKMDKLRRYDIYAPVTTSEKEYEYDFSVKFVLDTFKEFNPKIAKLAKRMFDEPHLDSEVRKNKRSGAVCYYLDPPNTPYVLMSYTMKVNDILTLAHELGHAVHAMLAEHHNMFNFDAPLPLAETASTFAEMLVTDQLLASETDENIKRDILFGQVAEAYATINRQIFFALFERKAHKMVNKDASVDDMSDAYLNLLKTQFGNSLDISDEFKWEWVAVPHFYHWPFYVYAYAFGQLLVLSLYQQYKKEGDSFIPRYLEILEAGGSAAPVEILDKAGINVRTPEFWQGGFDAISDMIDMLEAIPLQND